MRRVPLNSLKALKTLETLNDFLNKDLSVNTIAKY